MRTALNILFGFCLGALSCAGWELSVCGGPKNANLSVCVGHEIPTRETRQQPERLICVLDGGICG